MIPHPLFTALVIITFGFVLYGSFLYLPDKIDKLEVLKRIEDDMFNIPQLAAPVRGIQVDVIISRTW